MKKKNQEIINRIESEIKKASAWWADALEGVKGKEFMYDCLIAFFDAEDDNSEEMLNNLRTEFSKIEKNMTEDDIRPFERKFAILEKRVIRKPSDTFGETLKYFRELRKLSIAELARLANVSPSYLSRVERGERNTPSREIVDQLAEILSVTTADLLGTAVLEGGKGVPIPLASALFGNVVYVTNKNKALSNNDKENLMKIIEAIYKAEWDPNKNKTSEMIEIVSLIDNFKNNMKKEENQE